MLTSYPSVPTFTEIDETYTWEVLVSWKLWGLCSLWRPLESYATMFCRVLYLAPAVHSGGLSDCSCQDTSVKGSFGGKCLLNATTSAVGEQGDGRSGDGSNRPEQEGVKL